MILFIKKFKKEEKSEPCRTAREVDESYHNTSKRDASYKILRICMPDILISQTILTIKKTNILSIIIALRAIYSLYIYSFTKQINSLNNSN